MIDTPQMTRPARDTKPAEHQVGDVLLVDGVRWRIKAMNTKTRQVVLDRMSNPNHASYWTTTLENLPGRTS